MDNSYLRTVFLLAVMSWLGTAGGKHDMNEMSAMMYLDRYGYMDAAMEKMNMSANNYTHDVMVMATRQFQSFMGLKVTGNLDRETKAVMMKPRCGVKDMMGPAYSRRSKRYAHIGNVWEMRTVYYKFTGYSRKLAANLVRSEFKRAAEEWSRYVNVRLVPVWSRRRANVRVKFGRMNHGDPWPFDGPYGVLAHASQPHSEAFVHFDDDEKWTANRRGRNFYQTALHEIGHVLGLDHSTDKDAVMFPTVGENNPELKLHPDDINGIKALYDRRFGRFSLEEEWGQTSQKPATIIDKELCENPQIDVMFSDMNGELLVFKGGKMYGIAPEGGVLPHYPQSISERWPELPSEIQAAFTYSDRGTYFLTGSEVWKYEENNQRAKGFPKLIEEVFPGVPSDVDAAMEWEMDGSLFFFKGDNFWCVKNGPPFKGSIFSWPGIPGNLTAAFRYMGNSHFISGNSYYLFDDVSFEVVRAEIPYPRNVSSTWFGCSEFEEKKATPTSEAHCLQHTVTLMLTFSVFVVSRSIQ
ncbi:interstitial collagenase [Anabrus simplex]|uniref:interstitial collagenase n=1 Tax=Anabrus simplex TaxID=316456 RepID=UPI0035A27764